VAKTIFTPEQDEMLKQLYPVMGTDVVVFLPFTRKHISTRAYGLGLRVCKESKSKKAAIFASRPRPDLCGVDSNLFTNIHSPEIAYLLGMIWADGYVDKKSFRIMLSISENDANQIESVVSRTGKWSIRTWQPPGKRKPQKSFTISNKVIHHFLSENDYQSKSVSSACKILNCIPEQLQHYFWRGYFDGDGCISNRLRHGGHSSQMSLSGSFNQDWTFVSKLFATLNIEMKIQKQEAKHRYSRVVVYNMNDINTFFEYIYPEKKYDGIGLERKYGKWIEMLHNSSQSRYSTIKALSQLG